MCIVCQPIFQLQFDGLGYCSSSLNFETARGVTHFGAFHLFCLFAVLVRSSIAITEFYR